MCEFVDIVESIGSGRNNKVRVKLKDSYLVKLVKFSRLKSGGRLKS